MGFFTEWEPELDERSVWQDRSESSILDRFVGRAANTVETVADAYLKAWQAKQAAGLQNKQLELELKNNIAMGKLAAEAQAREYQLQLAQANQGFNLSAEQLKQYALLAVVGFVIYKVFSQ